MAYFWVGLGGALGSIARFWCSGLVANAFGGTFPWGTLLVNVVGSFIIGFTSTLTGPEGRMLVPADARTFVMVGFCGGYTTFSSFSLQTLALVQDGEWLRAGGNVVLSLVLCMVSVWLGHIAAARINQLKGA
jgi:CrcB protein